MTASLASVRDPLPRLDVGDRTVKWFVRGSFAGAVRTIRLGIAVLAGPFVL